MLFSALLPVVVAGAQDGRKTLYDAAKELGLEGIEEYVPRDILKGFTLPTGDDWKQFWQSLQSVRESGSLEDFAWILPRVRSALTILDSIKGGADFADWLRQELDYFEIADYVTKYLPAAGPTPLPVPTPAPLKKVISIAPPPKPKPVPVPEKVARERSTAISSVKLWKQKLAGRPPPPRAGELVPGLKQVFSRQGVPTQLVWVAEVESSFNPHARSPAGARGLFQFMPATAERFGLEVDPNDQRLHPEKIAAAAAQYLKYLYQKFDSWPLALAAYNAGEGTVGRVLKKHGAKNFNEAAYHLPNETQMYVPKVLATVSIREGIEPERLPPPSRPSS